MRPLTISAIAILAVSSIMLACESSSDEPRTADAGLGAEGGTFDSSTDSNAARWLRTALAGANIVPMVAVDPRDSNTVFIGISAGSDLGGFFRTKDGGKTWTKLTGNLPDGYAGSLALHRQNGTLLANPGVSGIWRSTDGGDTWVQAATDPGGTNGLLFPPTGNLAWTVTSQQGCFRSNDGGATWARTPNTGLPLNQFVLGPLAFDGTKLYLGTDQHGVYVSTDNGDSWTKAASTGLDGVSGSTAVNVVATSSRPGVLFVQNSFAGIFRSTDSGATFTKLEPGGAGTRYPGLALDPSNPQTIFVSANENQGGPGGIFMSTNDGLSWNVFGPNTVPVNAIDVASDGTAYAGTIGQGVWRFGK